MSETCNNNCESCSQDCDSRSAPQDFRAHLHGGAEGVHHVVHGAVQQHLDKHHQSGPQLGRVQPRFVSQDESVPCQPLDPLQHRRGGDRKSVV